MSVKDGNCQILMHATNRACFPLDTSYSQNAPMKSIQRLRMTPLVKLPTTSPKHPTLTLCSLQSALIRSKQHC